MFGGTNRSLAFIDIENRHYIGKIDGLAVSLINSIELCKVEKNKSDIKLLLTVTGKNYDYSDSKTDVLDITEFIKSDEKKSRVCLLYTSPSPRDLSTSRMPSSA